MYQVETERAHVRELWKTSSMDTYVGVVAHSDAPWRSTKVKSLLEKKYDRRPPRRRTPRWKPARPGQSGMLFKGLHPGTLSPRTSMHLEMHAASSRVAGWRQTRLMSNASMMSMGSTDRVTTQSFLVPYRECAPRVRAGLPFLR